MRLLIDADIIVYQSCAVVEKEVQWDEDTFTLHSTLEDAKAVFYDVFYDLQTQAGTDDVLLCFTDSSNWRKKLEPSYKSHRKSTRKPLAYTALVDYVRGRYPSAVYKNLEADDVLGIEATTNPESSIIWSADKDLKQVPGKHLIDDEIVTITNEQADRFHLYQTLCGDPSDGYKGCPGVGDKTAEKLLDASPTWETVCKAFAKAGLSEADALLQARLARILRKGEYKINTNEVKLWTP